MDDLMKAFAKISLSPVTLSKQQDVKFLPNMYSVILNNMQEHALACFLLVWCRICLV